MSILIKGIDLPKDDNYIVLEIEKNGTVEAYSSTFGEVDGDPTAIQIDRPHGRLIDGDLVADMLDSMMAHGTLNRAYDEVLDVPTILEAEENQ